MGEVVFRRADGAELPVQQRLRLPVLEQDVAEFGVAPDDRGRRGGVGPVARANPCLVEVGKRSGEAQATNWVQWSSRSPTGSSSEPRSTSDRAGIKRMDACHRGQPGPPHPFASIRVEIVQKSFGVVARAIGGHLAGDAVHDVERRAQQVGLGLVPAHRSHRHTPRAERRWRSKTLRRS